MPTATILGAEYQTVVMPDGREWMIQDLAATGSGMSTQSTPYGQIYKPDAAFLAVMATLTDGWHLPTQTEWFALGYAIDSTSGGSFDLPKSGGPLKAVSSEWAAPNTGATDAYGFSGYPNRNDVSRYPYHANWQGWWWTATGDGPSNRINAALQYDDTYLSFASNGVTDYAGVRLVRDYVPPSYLNADAHETTHALSIEWTEAADGTPIAYDDGATYDYIDSTITARMTPDELTTLETAWQSSTKLYTITSTGYLLGPLIDMSGGVQVRLMSYQVDQSADSAMTLYDVTIGVHYGPLSAPSAGSLAVVQSRGRPYHSVAPGAASWITEGGTSDVNAYGQASERSCTWYTHSLTTAQAADVVNALRTLRGSSTTWTAGGVATPWGPSESGTATVWIPEWSVHRESNLLWGVQMELVRNG